MVCDCSGNKILFDVNYPELENRDWCNKCEPICVGPKGPITVPIFNTTYVGRATKRYSSGYLNYYDCKKQRGGNCGDRNEFIASIFIKPARSINYVTLNFVAVRTGVEFEEVVGAV